ncbi:MAG: peptide chain release factor N(5)-glutamine methyltransferase [Rubrivivax sp.]|nr:peptide chain release factor N(5)-glutamine methyltransferase [Rubrivivax sp.]
MPEPLCIRDALDQARQAGVVRLDAQWLLGHLLQRPRAWLLAHDDEPLPASALTAWPTLLARRAGGEPLAYVLGEREFCGLRLVVSPAVLVPRPETELLVEWAQACWATAPAPSVIDLGTGSGAVALALKHRQPEARVLATDASAEALAVATANARALRVEVEFALGDWWHAAGDSCFGLALSNPPYIQAGDPHLAALRHEPLQALTPGGDGLDALRLIIAGAPRHLLPGAWLLLEHGHDQAGAVRTLLSAAGFQGMQTRADLAGQPRCTGAHLPIENLCRPEPA